MHKGIDQHLLASTYKKVIKHSQDRFMLPTGTR